MATIDRTSPMPLWAQVLEDLRRRLDAGEFVDGFPTDLELTDHYGVSRHTARDAVRRLQAEGIVSRERGRGTFVTGGTIQQATGAIYSLYRSIEALGITQRSRVLDLSVVTDPDAAAQLGVRATTSLVRLERVRLADDEPLAHDTAWLPASIARPLLDVDFTDTALYDEMATRCGIRPDAGNEWITTEVPSNEDQDLLGIDRATAVFRINRCSRAGDTVVEWRTTVVRGDRYSFVADWSASGSYQTVLTTADRR
ncbi:MAG: GntR family transcriptional regulator [Acidimicrobiales bacterium]